MTIEDLKCCGNCINYGCIDNDRYPDKIEPYKYCDNWTFDYTTKNQRKIKKTKST